MNRYFKYFIEHNKILYCFNESTGEVVELIEKPVVEIELQLEILKSYIKGNGGDNA